MAMVKTITRHLAECCDGKPVVQKTCESVYRRSKNVLAWTSPCLNPSPQRDRSHAVPCRNRIPDMSDPIIVCQDPVLDLSQITVRIDDWLW